MRKKIKAEKQKIQLYTVQVITKEDGIKVLNRTNDGFNVFELIGVLSLIQNDLYLSFEIEPKFDEINKVIK